MITLDQARTLSGKPMVGAGGEKLGRIDALYADREDGDPTFATVHTGAFGTKTHFVPLADASLSGDTVTGAVRQGPGELRAEHRPRRRARAGRGAAALLALRRRYRLAGRAHRHGRHDGHDDRHGRHGGDLRHRPRRRRRDTSTGTAGLAGAGEAPGAVGHDTSGPTTDNAMTRSEERLDVGTQQTEAGRARLRKYIVTERVRLGTETVSEDVREEQIDMAGDGAYPEGTSGRTSTDAPADRP